MTRKEKQAVKNSNKYCFFTSSCSIYEPKPIYLLSSYKCCNQCKNKDCDVRCCDKYEDCRLATTEEELLKISPTIKLSEKDVELFPPQEASSPTPEIAEKVLDKEQEFKPVASPAPPVTLTAQKAQKSEAKKQETTLSISQIAKQLNVSYDKVAYLIKVKKLTPQQAMDKLREKNHCTK